MKPKASIDKITVTIGARKLELTLEEARELKKVLNETLEPKTNVWPWSAWPPAPTIIYRDRWVPSPATWDDRPIWMRNEPYCGQTGLTQMPDSYAMQLTNGQ